MMKGVIVSWTRNSTRRQSRLHVWWSILVNFVARRKLMLLTLWATKGSNNRSRSRIAFADTNKNSLGGCVVRVHCLWKRRPFFLYQIGCSMRRRRRLITFLVALREKDRFFGACFQRKHSHHGSLLFRNQLFPNLCARSDRDLDGIANSWWGGAWRNNSDISFSCRERCCLHSQRLLCFLKRSLRFERNAIAYVIARQGLRWM
jgi:hypothetical protein